MLQHIRKTCVRETAWSTIVHLHPNWSNTTGMCLYDCSRWPWGQLQLKFVQLYQRSACLSCQKVQGWLWGTSKEQAYPKKTSAKNRLVWCSSFWICTWCPSLYPSAACIPAHPRSACTCGRPTSSRQPASPVCLAHPLFWCFGWRVGIGYLKCWKEELRQQSLGWRDCERWWDRCLRCGLVDSPLLSCSI